MITIILNPKEAQKLDYEQNWKGLVSFKDYLSIKEQQKVFERNEKGYQRYSTR
jgi:hypothetical protein